MAVDEEKSFENDETWERLQIGSTVGQFERVIIVHDCRH